MSARPRNARVHDALARTTMRERLVLALLLHERLTAAETACALRCTVEDVERIWASLRAVARAALRARRRTRVSRSVARIAVELEERQRRAS